RFAFHGESFAEIVRDVARGATETQHRVFFLGLVVAAADELAVLVGLEVRQTHDHGLGPEGGGDGGHALGNLVHVEVARRGMAVGGVLDRAVEAGALVVRIVEDGLGVDTDVVVDDEFEPREADAGIRQLGEIEGEVRIADVHHDLDRDFGQLHVGDFGDFGLKLALIDVAGVALGAAHGHALAFLGHVGGIAAADDGRNAEFARDDGGVAGTAAAVGDDGRSALHHRFPVGVGHVGDQHVAGLYLVHFVEVMYEAHGADADLLADGAALGQYRAVALELVAHLDLALGLALHGLGTGLQDVELAVGAVAAPFDVHRAAIVLFDGHGV